MSSSLQVEASTDQLQGVPEILECERLQQEKIDTVKSTSLEVEASQKKKNAEELLRLERDEQARIESELEECKTIEMKRIEKDGEAERKKQTDLLQKNYTKNEKAVREILVRRCTDNLLSLVS